MLKEIKGFSGYEVNENGEVFSCKSKDRTCKKMKPYIDKNGYEVFRLTSDDKKRKAYKCHRIVANTFIENTKLLPQVNHIDGNKRNNTVENLEWVTNSQNIKHAWDIGLIKGSPYGIIVRDTIKDEIVSYFNGYEKIAQLTGFKKTMLYDVVSSKKLLYGAFELTVNRNVDYSNESVFEKSFIMRTIDGNYKPCKWNNIVFDSIKSFESYLEIPHNKFRRLLKIGLVNGEKITSLTHYEYVTYV